ncbi:NADH dehydrogenase [ubiquinone] 1 alpha subcomplex assembly factor 2 [Microdochium nivale]|nr:NADH dehydrogenase [ubiquinone] 1 alpha subcomplex assembly factor 2 [Microdochium nivale]
MAGKPPGRILQAWYQWKALRLPWRKRFLVGLDLQGNTYWEFRLSRGEAPPRITSSATADQILAARLRRIVQYPRSSYASEVTIPPAWHQWLRYQRDAPPTLDEQTQNVARQERMKALAAQADQRWSAKPSYLDMPPTAAKEKDTARATAKEEGGGGTAHRQQMEQTSGQKDTAGSSRETQKSKEAKDEAPSPWKQAQKGGPGEEWQPQAWSPTPARRR